MVWQVFFDSLAQNFTSDTKPLQVMPTYKKSCNFAIDF